MIYKKKIQLWREQNLTIKVLKKNLTLAFDSKYLEEINHNYTRFNNTSIQVILTYLYDKYSEVD